MTSPMEKLPETFALRAFTYWMILVLLKRFLRTSISVASHAIVPMMRPSSARSLHAALIENDDFDLSAAAHG